MTQANVDEREVGRFAALASRWWDTDGDLRTLHDLNPTRLGFIESRWPLGGARVLDIGCGGGILSESMAALGAEVTGIDASQEAINVAKLHLHESGQQVNYRHETAEAHLAAGHAGQYDLVTCLEMLEHVPDPAAVVAACAELVRPGGAVCFSTLSRTPKSWAMAILGAEYIMGLLPKGTHDWSRFIKPSELDAWMREAGLHTTAISGVHYDPFTRQARLIRDVGVNYMVWALRP